MPTENTKGTIAIIGAGGVASYFVPLFLRLYEPAFPSFIQDGDTLEQRNLERQQFQEENVGQNKAIALSEENDDVFVGKPTYLESPENLIVEKENGLSCIFCFVDNHEARKFCLEASDRAGIPVIIAANEYDCSEAYIYRPSMKGKEFLDPRVNNPTILTSTEGSPLNCAEEQEASPQLAVANANAAILALRLYRLWFTLYEKEGLDQDSSDIKRTTAFYQGSTKNETSTE
jgi:hypothetical protein